VAVRPFPGISGAFAGRYFGTEAGSSQIMRQLIADRPRNVWESAARRRIISKPKGELVASTALSDRGVQFWDVQKKASRAILHGEVSTFTCMAFTRDSHTLITGDEHGAVRLWDVGSLKQKTMVPAHEGWVKGLAVSSTGETLVTGGNDGLVKVWDLAEVSGDRRRRQ
jgi:WD40 repeat protein